MSIADMSRGARADAGSDLAATMASIGRAARAAATALATAPSAKKDAALRAMAAAIRRREVEILKANEADLAAAGDLGKSFRDRLTLNRKRIAAMAQGLDEIAALPDPVGAVIAAWDRPNGLRIERVRTPLGVVGIIYESRPNVTADAGALCLKAGNAAILRAGSDSRRSSTVIASCLAAGLSEAGCRPTPFSSVPTRTAPPSA